MSVKKKPYLSEQETQDLTLALIEFNKADIPIKIFNRCFDYYVETYNIKPVRCKNWEEIIDIHKSYEYNRVEKSIKASMRNVKSNVVRDFDAMRVGRIAEVDGYIEVVRERCPTLGKMKRPECPVVVWKGIEKIATNYAQNYKFFSYVQKEDLIMSAIEKCLKFMNNFSGVSSNNAFSFFSSTVRNSFIENIKKEYEYSNFKQKINDDFYGSTNEEQSEMQGGDYIR